MQDGIPQKSRQHCSWGVEPQLLIFATAGARYQAGTRWIWSRGSTPLLPSQHTGRENTAYPCQGQSYYCALLPGSPGRKSGSCCCAAPRHFIQCSSTPKYPCMLQKLFIVQRSKAVRVCLYFSELCISVCLYIRNHVYLPQIRISVIVPNYSEGVTTKMLLSVQHGFLSKPFSTCFKQQKM